MWYLFLVVFHIILSMVVQQQVVILEFSQKMSACLSTLCEDECMSFYSVWRWVHVFLLCVKRKWWWVNTRQQTYLLKWMLKIFLTFPSTPQIKLAIKHHQCSKSACPLLSVFHFKLISDETINAFQSIFQIKNRHTITWKIWHLRGKKQLYLT